MDAASVNEKIRWPWWLMGLVFSLDISILIAIWAGLGNSAALISVFVLTVLTVVLYFFTSLTIRVVGDELFVGRAHINKEYIGQVELLSAEEMKRAYGVGLDPASYLAIRFWVKGGLKISLNDPRDPTPYWLVSSKKPERIRAAIQAQN